MEHGIVKWFNAEKGFGMIAPDNGGRDVFVHKASIRDGSSSFRYFVEGDMVTFDIVNGPKGLEAKNVSRR